MTQARQVSKSGVAYGQLRSPLANVPFESVLTVSPNLTRYTIVGANYLDAASNRLTVLVKGTYLATYFLYARNQTGSSKNIGAAIFVNNLETGMEAVGTQTVAGTDTVTGGAYFTLSLTGMADLDLLDYIEVFHKCEGGPNTFTVLDEQLNVVKIG
jgi:hypothetical protein